MRYIKKFENITEEDFDAMLKKIKQGKIDEEERIFNLISKLKKYFIYKDERRLLIIEKFISGRQRVISRHFSGEKLFIHFSGEKLFIYLYEVGELKPTFGQIGLDDIDSVIFTSDDIEECKEKLLMVVDQIKFNI